MHCPVFRLPEVLKAVSWVPDLHTSSPPSAELRPLTPLSSPESLLPSFRSHQVLSLGGLLYPVLSLTPTMSLVASVTGPCLCFPIVLTALCSVEAGRTVSVGPSGTVGCQSEVSTQCPGHTRAKGPISSSQEKSGETSWKRRHWNSAWKDLGWLAFPAEAQFVPRCIGTRKHCVSIGRQVVGLALVGHGTETQLCKGLCDPPRVRVPF